MNHKTKRLKNDWRKDTVSLKDVERIVIVTEIVKDDDGLVIDIIKRDEKRTIKRRKGNARVSLRMWVRQQLRECKDVAQLERLKHWASVKQLTVA